MRKPKLYVGCALRRAPEEFRRQVYLLQEELRGDFEVLQFLGLDADTPERIFSFDIRQVRECECLLAICDHPSFGLGFEVGEALRLGKPVLAVAAEGTDVSNFVLGITHPSYTFQRYTMSQDVVGMVHQHFLP